MSEETYTVRNGFVADVTVKASYYHVGKVPTIGQKKRMRVNGKPQTMYLLKIEAERNGEYDEDEHLSFRYDTTETWGGYYDF